MSFSDMTMQPERGHSRALGYEWGIIDISHFLYHSNIIVIIIPRGQMNEQDSTSSTHTARPTSALLSRAHSPLCHFLI